MMTARMKIDVLEHAERCGNYSIIEKMLARFGNDLDDPCDPNTTIRYGHFMDRIKPALEYESKFGEGSLLVLDNPFNEQLIRLGLIARHNIDAAMRHRQRAAINSQGPKSAG